MLGTHNPAIKNYEFPWGSSSASQINPFVTPGAQHHFSFDVPAHLALRPPVQSIPPPTQSRRKALLAKSKMTEAQADMRECATAKIERHKYTAGQIELLLEIFKEIKYPNLRQRRIIGRRMDIQPEQVKTWFQNRRRRTLLEGKNKITENAGQNKKEADTAQPEKKLISDNIVKSILQELNSLGDSQDEAIKKKNKGFKRKHYCNSEPKQLVEPAVVEKNPPKRVVVDSDASQNNIGNNAGTVTSHPSANQNDASVALDFTIHNKDQRVQNSNTKGLDLSMLTPQDSDIMQKITAAAAECGSVPGLPSYSRASDAINGGSCSLTGSTHVTSVTNSHTRQNSVTLDSHNSRLQKGTCSLPVPATGGKQKDETTDQFEKANSVKSDRLSSRHSSYDEMSQLWGGHGQKAVVGTPDLHDKLLGVSDGCPPPNRVAPSPLTAEYLAITNDINGYPYATPFCAFSSILDTAKPVGPKPPLSKQSALSDNCSIQSADRPTTDRNDLIEDNGVIPPNRIAPPSGPIPFFPSRFTHASPLQVAVPAPSPYLRLPPGTYQGLLQPLTPESRTSSSVSYLPDDVIVRRLMNFAPKEVQKNHSRQPSRTSSMSDDIDVETIDDIVDEGKDIFGETTQDKAEDISVSPADVPTSSTADISAQLSVFPSTNGAQYPNHTVTPHSSLPPTSLPGLQELMAYKTPTNASIGQAVHQRTGSVNSFSLTSSGSSSSPPSLASSGLDDLYMNASFMASASPGRLSSLRNHVDPMRYSFPYGTNNPLSMYDHHRPLTVTSFPNPFYGQQ
ncbi:uncharacterized protein LOC106162695 [Lingula anatina]|uniref:Uncharacterized protein LOC106162695 n=1 Tax=Lingula anatina TaxID=7574 RepID=A0A1S3IB68_LINAN|nr:uncharacterized protein LOC106162695 [Lingula anatina]|eukprot:XP_013395510.1 uncharacterized protein LOC106162695 [Lingula anatina]